MNHTASVFFLHALPYGDSSLILSGFSAEHGKLDLMAKGIKKAKSKKAAFLRPMLQQEWTYIQKDPTKLGILKNIHSEEISTNIYPEAVHQHMFIAELLYKSLQKHTSYEALFAFTRFLLAKTNSDFHANMHIVFLIEYIKSLGYSPDISSYKANAELDMLSGKFVASSLKGFNPAESEKVFHLLGTDFDTAMSITFGKGERTQLLTKLIVYLQLHIEGFPNLKTLDVLQSLYRD